MTFLTRRRLPRRPFRHRQPSIAESVCRDAGRSCRSVAIEPVPYLLDRARNLATRDFLSLLQDLLSDEAIAALKKGK